MALFADDAVYVEPFGGETRTHVGKDAIRASLRAGWANHLPEMTLTLHRVDVEGAALRMEWTCASSAFPAPMRGTDRFVLRDGKIARLETRILGPER